jgi:ribosomal protein S3AE
LARALYQMTKPPIFVGGVALATGYFRSLVRRDEKSISQDLATFTRREQMLRLKKIVGGL